MKDKIFGVLQRVGRSFMLPIAILPVAGLLLGFGGSFTNETMLETYGLLNVMGPGTMCCICRRISTGECNHLYEDAGRNGTYDTNAALQNR